MPLDAVAGSVRVTLWLFPGVTLNGEAGVVVVPPGNPEIATETGLLNPLRAVTDVVKDEFEEPALAVKALGDMAIVKSEAGSTVKASVAVCTSEPDVPVRVTV